MALYPEADRREAVCAWLTANGINPADVPEDADITVDKGPAGRFLRCEVFDLTEDGHRQLDEHRETIATMFVNVPLKVDPPDRWQPHQKPTRDQLMGSIREALPALRQAITELPAVCRYHGDRLDPHTPSYGSEACCDTGRPALRRRKAEEALQTLVAQEDSA